MIYLLLCVSLFTCLEAAFPVTHAYFAKQYFKHFPGYSPEEEKLFMVGTLFPDIRYLGEAARNETHFETMTLREIVEEPSPFLAGLKFHSYVDLVRENLVVETGMYSRFTLPTKGHEYSFLKLVEDEILYTQADWGDMISLFWPVYPEELMWGMQESTVAKWHWILRVFFVNDPHVTIQILSLFGKGMMGMSSEEIREWNILLPTLAQEDTMQTWVETLVQHFDARFASY